MVILREQVIRILDGVFNGRCSWESCCRVIWIWLRRERRREFAVNHMLERELAPGATQLRDRTLHDLRVTHKAVLMESVPAGCGPRLGAWVTE